MTLCIIHNYRYYDYCSHIVVYVGKRTSEQDGDHPRQAISYFQPSALLFVTGSLLSDFIQRC